MGIKWGIIRPNQPRNEGTGLVLETHGDSPLGGIWEIDIPSLVGPGESINLTILEKGEVALERAVWIAADESAITVHVSARCSSRWLLIEDWHTRSWVDWGGHIGLFDR